MPRGISARRTGSTSLTRRMLGRAGNTNSFCAWYSLRMSFCSVPPSGARVDARLLRGRDVHREEHRRGRVDRHRRGDGAEVDVAVEVLDVGERVDRHAALPDLADRERVVGVAAHQGRQVEGGGQAVTPRGEKILEPPIRVDRRAEAGEHPHRPELRAVHLGVRAAGVRVLPRALGVVRPVDRVDLDPRVRREVPLRHAAILSRAPNLDFGVVTRICGGESDAKTGGRVVSPGRAWSRCRAGGRRCNRRRRPWRCR